MQRRPAPKSHPPTSDDDQRPIKDKRNNPLPLTKRLCALPIRRQLLLVVILLFPLLSAFALATRLLFLEFPSHNSELVDFRSTTVDQSNTGEEQNVPASIKDDKDLAPIVAILRQAGYDLNNKEVFDRETLSSLPNWTAVNEFYGKPKIYGLETCELFRQSISEKDRKIGVAGTFNSGTNLLSSLLTNNVRSRMNVLWQVPWGKHRPPSYRLNHSTKGSVHVNQTAVLPVVVVR
jgi:hypothetical protein